MSNPQKVYISEISKKTSYRANWLPDKPLNIGDIGKLEDGIFTLYTTLEQQNIPLEIRPSPSSLDFDYTSKDTVRVVSDLGASAPVAAGTPVNGKFSVKIDFQNNSGVLFQVTGSQKQIISNLDAIEKNILAKYKNNEWNLEWVVITEIVKTDSATIIINTGSSNTLEFEASGDAGLKTINLADARLGLKLMRESGTSTKIIAKEQLTPLYVVKGITDPLFGKAKFRGVEQLRAVQFNELKAFPFNPNEIE